MMKNDVVINEYERLDDLHRSGLMIIQNPKQFCFGIDAVLLTGFAKVRKNEVLLDLCTGTGVIPMLLSAKTNAKHLTGVDIQADSIDMAKRSVIYNGIEEKLSMIEGDVKNIECLVKSHSFDVVTANPPYMESGGGIVGEYSPKAIARHEVLVGLDDVVKAAAYSLKYKGRFYMVHKPHRLVDIMCSLRKYELEAKTIRFVQPYENKEPNMVLVEACYKGKPMVKVLPPLIVYDNNGNYTEECYNIYYG